MSKLLQLNRENWKVSQLGECAILMELEQEGYQTAKVRKVLNVLESVTINHLIDIIPAYHSIALLFKSPVNLHLVSELLAGINWNDKKNSQPQKYEVPVCYDLGLDWAEVEDFTQIEKAQIVETHSSQVYTVAMMGFVPGFIFLEGLDSSLACARKSNPRTSVPKGSIGIGGQQTGIYSLESPGGWQIIGRTPLSFFDVESNPPIKLQPDDKLIFKAISKDVFDHFEYE